VKLRDSALGSEVVIEHDQVARDETLHDGVRNPRQKKRIDRVVYRAPMAVVESIDEVVTDLDGMLAQAAGAHAFATHGLRMVAERFSSMPRYTDNPDPVCYLGLGDPNEANSQTYARFKASELPGLLAQDGPVVLQLGQQWAVFVFAEWDHFLRPRLARARGCDNSAVQVTVFGDLRRIRHDIVHNRGTATREYCGRCELLRWFKPGERLVIRAEHIAEFMSQMPWDALRAPSGRQSAVVAGDEAC